MAYQIAFTRRAQREARKVADWYQEKGASPDRFVDELDILLRAISDAPLKFSEIVPGVRRALLQRFPYAVFFSIKFRVARILAVLHTSRNPARWPKAN